MFIENIKNNIPTPGKNMFKKDILNSINDIFEKYFLNILINELSDKYKIIETMRGKNRVNDQVILNVPLIKSKKYIINKIKEYKSKVIEEIILIVPLIDVGIININPSDLLRCNYQQIDSNTGNIKFMHKNYNTGTLELINSFERIEEIFLPGIFMFLNDIYGEYKFSYKYLKLKVSDIKLLSKYRLTFLNYIKNLINDRESKRYIEYFYESKEDIKKLKKDLIEYNDNLNIIFSSFHSTVNNLWIKFRNKYLIEKKIKYKFDHLSFMYASIKYITNIQKKNHIDNFGLIKKFGECSKISNILLAKGWISNCRYPNEDIKFDYYSDVE